MMLWATPMTPPGISQGSWDHLKAVVAKDASSAGLWPYYPGDIGHPRPGPLGAKGKRFWGILWVSPSMLDICT